MDLKALKCSESYSVKISGNNLNSPLLVSWHGKRGWQIVGLHLLSCIWSDILRSNEHLNAFEGTDQD